MTKFKMMPLVAMISAGLMGCGGGSGSSGGGGGTPPPPSSPKYTWTIVELVRESNPSASCATFYSHSDTIDPKKSYSVIARLATQGYKILFHNADGSVLSDRTIEGDAISSGKITIDSAKVPKDGYVSLEEYSGFNAGDRESYQVAFHASLLQNMVLTVRNDQPASNSCLSGERVSKQLDASKARLTVSTINSPVFYQTSASDLRVSGLSQQVNIPVVADSPAKERKIVTSYAVSPASGTYEQLNSYLIASSDWVYQQGQTPSRIELMKDDITAFDVSVDSRLELTTQSNISVVLDAKIYNWQAIFSQADHTTSTGYASNETQLSGWNVNVFTKTDLSSGEWGYTSHLSVDGSDINIDQPSSLFDFSTSSVASSGLTSLDGYTSTEWTVQRTHVRTVSNSNSRPIIQTIYSVPNSNQPMVASSTEAIGDISNAKISISLAGSDEVNKLVLLNQLLENAIDFETLSDPNQVINTHKYDLNGGVISEKASLTNKLKMAGKNVEFANNSVGW
ncbi:hypothetical protein KY888_002469 [Vibrio vulnificus]|nr:hypothetical protein [Vibrio vulnificus]